jgi:hypothetical protein
MPHAGGLTARPASFRHTPGPRGDPVRSTPVARVIEPPHRGRENRSAAPERQGGSPCKHRN